jgi:hypothetical protein
MLIAQLARNPDLDRDDQIPSTDTVGEALARQTEELAGLGARRDRHLRLSFQERNVGLSSEHGGQVIDLHVAFEIETFSFERTPRLNSDMDQKISRRTPLPPGGTHPPEP